MPAQLAQRTAPRSAFRLVCAPLLLASIPVAAQPPAGAIQPGARVRITAATLGPFPRVTGYVTAATAESLTVRSGVTGYPLALAWREVTALELSRGPGSVVPGIAVGTTLGTATGAASGFVTWTVFHELVEAIFPECLGCIFEPTEEDRRQWKREDARQRRKWTVIGAVLGAAGGALIGSRHPRERWERVAAPPARVSVAPRDGGLAAGLTVAF